MDEAHEEVTHLLTSHREQLDSLAHALLDELFGDAPTKEDLDHCFEGLLRVGNTVSVWGGERDSGRLSARDDGDLTDGVCLWGEHSDQGVARLVVGGAFTVFWAEQDHPTARPAGSSPGSQ